MAFRAVGMFRWRAKEELLRRGLDDTSPAARGASLLSVELLSRDHPSTVNSVRPLLHKMLNDYDENATVRRLAVMALKNGSRNSARRSSSSTAPPPTTRSTRICAARARASRKSSSAKCARRSS